MLEAEPDCLVDDGRAKEEPGHVARQLVPALRGVVERLRRRRSGKSCGPCASRRHSKAATRALNSVTLIWIHMASPVTRVSVPNTMLTAPAMKGTIGGRPSTMTLVISATMVVMIERPRPGGNAVNAVDQEHRDQRPDFAEDVDGLVGIERIMTSDPLHLDGRLFPFARPVYTWTGIRFYLKSFIRVLSRAQIPPGRRAAGRRRLRRRRWHAPATRISQQLQRECRRARCRPAWS